MKGDIVLVRFPFTDLSAEKLRPALSLHEHKEDTILAFITTQIKLQENLDVPLNEPITGLKKPSVLKLRKITTLTKKSIAGKIGQIPSKKVSIINENLQKILKL